MFSTPFTFLKFTPSGGGLDPDAQAFLTATGITDPTIETAINDLVVDLKAASLWSLFYAIYPLVGGTSTTCKYNLVDPQDTDGAYRLTFSGGWTFSSSGIEGNASNTYANTYFVPSTDFTSYYNSSLGVYTTDNSAAMTGYLNVPMAANRNTAGASVFQFALDLGSGTGVGVYDAYNEGNRILINPAVQPAGLTWVDNAGFNGTAIIYKNATSQGSTTINISNPQIEYSFYIGARNTGGTPNYYTGNQFSFAFISDQIGTANATALYTIVQDFQTALGRQV